MKTCYRNTIRFAFGFLSLSVAGLTLGCGKLTSKHIDNSSTVADFLKSEVIVSSAAVANGADPLTVYVRLLNSNNTPVVGFKPTYTVSSSAGVVPTECFTSDVNGLSICVIKSTSAGTKTFQVTNISAVNLQANITFSSQVGLDSQTQILAGGAQKVTAGTYKVSSSVGGTANMTKLTAGTYTVYSNVQGSVESPKGGL